MLIMKKQTNIIIFAMEVEQKGSWKEPCREDTVVQSHSEDKGSLDTIVG